MYIAKYLEDLEVNEHVNKLDEIGKMAYLEVWNAP